MILHLGILFYSGEVDSVSWEVLAGRGSAWVLGRSFAIGWRTKHSKDSLIASFTLSYSHIIAEGLYTYCSSY